MKPCRKGVFRMEGHFYTMELRITMDKDDGLYQRIEALAGKSGGSAREIIELLVYDGLYSHMETGLPLVERTFERYGQNCADG